MATLHYTELFTLHWVGFGFQLPNTEIGSESESASVNGNKKCCRVTFGNISVSDQLIDGIASVVMVTREHCVSAHLVTSILVTMVPRVSM